MNRTLFRALHAYRQHRAATAHRKLFKVTRYFITVLLVAYMLTIIFPQFLFAHEVSYKGYRVHSAEPLDQNIYQVLDEAEARLASSPLNDESVARKIFLCGSRGMYALLSNKAYKSSANSIPGIDNILINKSSVADNLIFPRQENSRPRNLSSTIAHEVTHLLIRRRYGYLKNSLAPAWKKEGYCEYVGGESNIDCATGVKRWKENPQNDKDYAYFKYYMMVKYLIEVEKLSVDDIFRRSFDARELEAKVLKSLVGVRSCDGVNKPERAGARRKVSY